MTGSRRLGAKLSETRSYLLDVAEQLMRDEGYAAISSRRLGSYAGLSPQIVYYYFRTMDDLFEALLLRILSSYLHDLEQIANSEDPLTGMWMLSCDPYRVVIVTELMALANHRKPLQGLIAKFNEDFTDRQIAILQIELDSRGVELAAWPPRVIATIMENLARGFAIGVNYNLEKQTEAREKILQMIEEVVSKPKVMST